MARAKRLDMTQGALFERANELLMVAEHQNKIMALAEEPIPTGTIDVRDITDMMLAAKAVADTRGLAVPAAVVKHYFLLMHWHGQDATGQTRTWLSGHTQRSKALRGPTGKFLPAAKQRTLAG